MAQEAYGFLFPIAAKDRKENGPSMTGKAILNSKEVEIAAWTKKSKAGDKYLSLKFQGYELSAEAGPPEAADDDLLF